VSDRLAKQVASVIVGPPVMGDSGRFISGKTLSALAELVEAVGKLMAARAPIYNVGDCVCQYGEREHSSSDCPLGLAEDAECAAAKKLGEALRRVAESLGINEAPTKETK
jgi:hypothetical protein